MTIRSACEEAFHHQSFRRTTTFHYFLSRHSIEQDATKFSPDLYRLLGVSMITKQGTIINLHKSIEFNVSSFAQVDSQRVLCKSKNYKKVLVAFYGHILFSRHRRSWKHLQSKTWFWNRQLVIYKNQKAITSQIDKSC